MATIAGRHVLAEKNNRSIIFRPYIKESISVFHSHISTFSKQSSTQEEDSIFFAPAYLLARPPACLPACLPACRPPKHFFSFATTVIGVKSE